LTAFFEGFFKPNIIVLIIMKLPSHLRKLRKFTFYSLSFYVLILVMFSPVPQIYAASSSLGNSPWFSNEDLSNSRMETEIIVIDSAVKKDIRPEEVGFSYNPIDTSSNAGSSFSVDELITVDHSDILNLQFEDTSNTITDSYSITEPSGFSVNNLQYGIQEIEGIQDYYQIENDTSYSLDELSIYDYTQLAQGFEIKWDYAEFYGAKIYLDQAGIGPWGAYTMELYLVEAESTSPFEPNMSSIVSSDVNDPYNSSNLLPASSIDNIYFYDFTDVILTKGIYYIVANMTIEEPTDVGSHKHFAWHKKLGGEIGGNTFRQNFGYIVMEPHISSQIQM
jgi:hypothetical protein